MERDRLAWFGVRKTKKERASCMGMAMTEMIDE